MQDRFKQLLNKILEMWNKYTKKQKTIILSTVGAVVIMLLLLAYFFGRTTYTRWRTFEDVGVAKSVDQLLTESGIAHKIGDDSVTIYVDSKKTVQANYAIVGSSLMEEGRVTLEELLKSDMSTTNYEKNLKSAEYTMAELESYIEGIEGVEKAQVRYIPIDRTSTILDENKEIPCSVFLTINSKFNTSVAATSIAVTVANALGNKTGENVKIIDQHGNMLYSGPEDEETLSLSNQHDQWVQTNNFYRDSAQRYGLFLGFDYVDAEFSLDVNYDKIEEYLHEYLPAEGQEQGLQGIYEHVASENTNGQGDIPGTDSNDENDYYIQNTGSGSSSYESTKITYLPSERTVKTMRELGIVNLDNSSGAIVLKRVRQYTERELEVLGLLGEMTYEEYKIRNSQPVQVTDEELVASYREAFSMATGIDASRLSLRIIEIPTFIDEVEEGFNWNLLLTILLFVVIIGLLIFVVFRVSKPEEVIETEPELSVEKLLATTKENQSLEDLEFSEGSETKRLIEKFVDENPEAVAALLRNWLSDDWG
ncbi:MAG: hypothetical protein K2N63_15065 [Lachnospiraceae bacterium]|nr:hypothetical protein [Lachnospiraceae bacterium]